MDTSKVKRHRKQATMNHNKTTALKRSVIELLGDLKLYLRAQPHHT